MLHFKQVHLALMYYVPIWFSASPLIQIHHPKSLCHLWLPLLRLLFWLFSSEAPSIGLRVLINEVILLGRACPVLWISIICSSFKIFKYSRERIDCIAKTSHETGVFRVNLRFFQNVIQTINAVHFTKFVMQNICLCHEVYNESSYYCLN